jgi:SAM-dependent methyltransferase
MKYKIVNTYDDKRIADDWIRTVESEKGRVRELDIYPALRAWSKNILQGDILEIGCGQGICSEKIDLENKNYTGIDSSQLLLKRARELYRDGHRSFVSGSAYDLPFSENSFEGVFSVVVWHLLSDLRKAASEIDRVLKVGGNFLIVTSNPDAYPEWTSRYMNKHFDEQRFEGDYCLDDGSLIHEVLYLHTWDELKASLEESGLRINKIETFRKSTAPNGPNLFLSVQGSK